MFGMSGSELLIIAILALVLLGPERLPEVAKTLGRFGREFRTAADGLKSQVQAGLGEDTELGRTFGQAMRDLRQVADGLKAEVAASLEEGPRRTAPTSAPAASTGAAPAPPDAPAAAHQPRANGAPAGGGAAPTDAPAVSSAPALADLKVVSLGELAGMMRPAQAGRAETVAAPAPDAVQDRPSTT